MKIAKMRSIDGLEIATEVRGVVQESMMIVQEEVDEHDNPHSKVLLKVNDKNYSFSAAYLPRIDVGEEVVLHFGKNSELMGFQVTKGDVSIFRMKIVFYRMAAGYHSFSEQPRIEDYSYDFDDE
ncbi:MAG: hypothetical protein V1928_02840 [Parcubacteria group bacterium]